MNNIVKILTITIITIQNSILLSQQNPSKEKEDTIIYEIKYEFIGKINSQGNSMFSYYYVFSKNDFDKLSNFEITKPEKIKSKKNNNADSQALTKEEIKTSSLQTSSKATIKDNKVYIKIFQSDDKIPFNLKAVNKEGKAVKLLYRD